MFAFYSLLDLGDIQPGHEQNSLKSLQKSPFVSVKNQQPLEAQQQFVKNG